MNSIDEILYFKCPIDYFNPVRICSRDEDYLERHYKEEMELANEYKTQSGIIRSWLVSKKNPIQDIVSLMEVYPKFTGFINGEHTEVISSLLNYNNISSSIEELLP